MRADIQALRAAAVAMVLLFHLWPNRFGGGFGGVDVFFVISGFLITSSLVSETSLQAFRDSKISALSNFWLRRIRRLLPMALLVILATVLGSAVLVPASARSEFTWDAIASIFYFENFKLALGESDYFAASAPNPFQHFWSLAVEEQFYLVWPVLIGLLFVRTGRRTALLALSAITFTSFVFSIWQSMADGSFAYFNTATRVWQFGLGALLAVGLAPQAEKIISERGRLVGAVAGFGAIVLSTFLLDESLPFPGWQALLPTIGTAAVIWARANTADLLQQNFVGAALRRLGRTITWLGDISYSLYLWHWPVIILAGYSAGRALNNLELVAVGLAALVLAHFSKKQVEDRIRHSVRLRELPNPRQFVFAAATSLVVFGFALAGGSIAAAQVVQQEQKIIALEKSDCFGARAVGNSSCRPVPAADVVPSLDFAKRDAADPGSICMVKALETEPNFCNITEGSKRVLLIGDSHAATHLGALRILATDQNWSLDMSYHAGCSFSLVERNTEPRGVACAEWNRLVTEKLAEDEPYDLVITASYARNRLADLPGVTEQQLTDGFIAAYKPLLARGSKIAVIRDNPEMDEPMKQCFENAVRDASECSMPVTNAFVGDPAVSAASALKNVQLLDFTDVYCPEGICSTVVGGVYVYRNADHITATFSRSMSDVFAKRLEFK